MYEKHVGCFYEVYRQVAIKHCSQIGCGRENSKRFGRYLKYGITLHLDWFTLRFFSASSSQAERCILCIMCLCACVCICNF